MPKYDEAHRKLMALVEETPVGATKTLLKDILLARDVIYEAEFEIEKAQHTISKQTDRINQAQAFIDALSAAVAKLEA